MNALWRRNVCAIYGNSGEWWILLSLDAQGDFSSKTSETGFPKTGFLFWLCVLCQVLIIAEHEI